MDQLLIWVILKYCKKKIYIKVFLFIVKIMITRYNILYILFALPFIIVGGICVYVSYKTFYVDSDDFDDVEEEYNIMINQNKI